VGEGAREKWVGPHPPGEEGFFYGDGLSRPRQLWGAFETSDMVGVIAFGAGWVDQLYVLPSMQRRGVGSHLLGVAQREFDQLQLWTFQCNVAARRFYEAKGFVLVQETNGTRNEEQEPDALYRWRRGG